MDTGLAMISWLKLHCLKERKLTNKDTILILLEGLDKL
jgi:hypothetical protein